MGLEELQSGTEVPQDEPGAALGCRKGQPGLASAEGAAAAAEFTKRGGEDGKGAWKAGNDS